MKKSNNLEARIVITIYLILTLYIKTIIVFKQKRNEIKIAVKTIAKINIKNVLIQKNYYFM